MTSPFKLAAHPRRLHSSLSDPPAGYFDQLPLRVMARLPRAAPAEAAAGWRWLAVLSPALRTGLAAVAVLGSFAASFFLSSTPRPGKAAATTASLDVVPRTELVGYLLASGTRVETADLAMLTATDPNLAKGFLHVSDAELNDALDTQPADELTYL